MIKFMDFGAVRVDGKSGAIDLRKKPTSEQLSRIRQIGETAGHIVCDLVDGDRKAAFETDDAKRAVGLIQRFYRGQDLGSEDISQGRYSPQAPEYKEALWHGTPSGDLRGSKNGLHVGTYKAAEQALGARIGIPATGTWDGTREYGKTLIAGKKTLQKIDPNGYNQTGFNSRPPEEDYYPHGKATYGDGTLVAMDAKPNIIPVRIKGRMTNIPERAYSDARANGLMRGMITRGNAKSGFYYLNDGEDSGSISAVVPNGSHLEILEPKPKEQGEARH